MGNTHKTHQLAHNWATQADPFYGMVSRDGFPLEAVRSLTPAEAIRAAMGDTIANVAILNGAIDAANAVQAALFAALCYLRLRQAGGSFQFPIAYGERFCFPSGGSWGNVHIAGLEILRQYGSHVEPAELGKAKPQWDKIQTRKHAEAFGMETWAIRQADHAGRLASAYPGDYVVLTYASSRNYIEKTYGQLENIRYVDPNWTRVFDFNATYWDVATVIDWIAGATQKGGESQLKVEPTSKGFTVNFDGNEFFVSETDGVFETSRNLRVNNTLFVTPLTGVAANAKVPAENLSLVNSYGTFLYGVLVLGAPHLCTAVPEFGQLAKKLLNQLPCTSDDEARALDGDRIGYDRYVTVTRMGAADLPFGFARFDGKCKLTYNRDVSVSSLGDIHNDRSGGSHTAHGIKGTNLPAKDAIDRSALLAFNLVRMPRGQFIDGRRSCVQLQHVPAKYRAEFVRAVLAPLAGTDEAGLAQYCRDTFKVTGTDEQVFAAVESNLIVGLSSKLAKLIKRTAMDSACVAEFVNGKGRGLVRYGQEQESVNNLLIEAVVSPHAIFPAGMACYWGEHPSLVVRHTQKMQPVVPPTQNVAGAVLPIFDGGEPVLTGGWYSVKYPGLRIEDGEILADIPFEVDGATYRHQFVNKVPDARLVELKWRSTKMQGNKSTLQVVAITTTIEHQLKGRNNIKCMLSRYTSDVVVNELNTDVAARSVFFADTNKWLDLVQGCADVAACTAINNGDEEGIALIAKANALVNAGHANNLVWSPALAVTGAYQELISWFEAKFGRALWFKHADPTGEWTGILRRMYGKAEGWQQVDPATVGYAIPAGATNVLVVCDGSVNNDRDNVLVLFELDGCSYFLQRAWSYAGSSVTGPVWQPVKAELSSVRAAVGKTPLMAGVARAVEQVDPAYAQRLAKDGNKQIHKSAVFFAMAKNNTIKSKGVELPMHVLGDASTNALLQTAELQALVSAPENAGRLLEVIAPLFRDRMFSVTTAKGNFSIYLPAVMAQDSAADFASTDSMSDLITQLMVQAILGADVNNTAFQDLASRAIGSLRTLVQSAGLIKSGAFCRMSVQCKTQALPGIPVGEVWVRESARKNSVHQTMARTFQD